MCVKSLHASVRDMRHGRAVMETFWVCAVHAHKAERILMTKRDWCYCCVTGLQGGLEALYANTADMEDAANNVLEEGNGVYSSNDEEEDIWAQSSSYIGLVCAS